MQMVAEFSGPLTAAFKEWALVVDALARGEQIFILRKGGIHEGRGGFSVEFPRFLLFQTLFHQQRAAVMPRAQSRYDEIAPFFPPPGLLRIGHWAELVEWQALDTFDSVRKLAGMHIWKEEVLAERFDWGRESGIYALAVRVYRLPVALELPMLPEYGGCKSWVQIAHPVNTNGSVPVLNDGDFGNQLAMFTSRLRQGS